MLAVYDVLPVPVNVYVVVELSSASEPCKPDPETVHVGSGSPTVFDLFPAVTTRDLTVIFAVTPLMVSEYLFDLPPVRETPLTVTDLPSATCLSLNVPDGDEQDTLTKEASSVSTPLRVGEEQVTVAESESLNSLFEAATPDEIVMPFAEMVMFCDTAGAALYTGLEPPPA